MQKFQFPDYEVEYVISIKRALDDIITGLNQEYYEHLCDDELQDYRILLGFSHELGCELFKTFTLSKQNEKS